MTSSEWHGQWKRLNQFQVPQHANRDAMSAEWFAQLKHHHVDAVEHGITQLIGAAQDTFMPGLGVLKDFINARLSRYERTHGECGKCNGATWVESWPWWSNGRVYVGFDRCTDCGVPAPEYKAPEGRRMLTAAEYQQWKDGTLNTIQEPVSRPNRAVMEALQCLDAKRGMSRLIHAAPRSLPSSVGAEGE